MNRNAWALTITALRGAKKSFAVLALIGLAFSALGWFAVRGTLLTGRAPREALVMFAPIFGAFFGVLSAVLVFALFMRAHRVAAGRLAPGAGPALRRSMTWAAVAEWLGIGLPALVVVLTGSTDPRVGLPSGVALFYGLGLPTAGVAAIAAFIALSERGWVRHVLPWPVLVGVIGLPQLVLLPLSLRDPALLAVGLVGLLFSAWVFPQVARKLTRANAFDDGAVAVSASSLASVAAGFAGEAPRDSRWLVAPHAPNLRAQHLMWIVGYAVLVGIVLQRFSAAKAEFAGHMMLIMLSAIISSRMGVWVSPRWMLLPGGPSRRGLAWRALQQTLRNGLPVVLAFILPFAVVIIVSTEIPVRQWLAVLLACSGIAVMCACLAAATPPWGRSDNAMHVVPVAAPVVGAAACMAVLGVPQSDAARWQQFSGEAFLSSVALALGLIAVGLLAVAASSRAWARYDWSRMPPRPGRMGLLLRDRQT